MLCGYRFQKFIIAKVFFATALYYMLKQLTRMTQNFCGFLILQFLWLSKKEFQQKKLPQKNLLHYGQTQMQTVSNNKVSTSLEQSVVLGALDVIVIEWWWLLHFVLHMHSIVRNIVLKSISWLHILNRKNIINAFECNFLKIAKIATICNWNTIQNH